MKFDLGKFGALIIAFASLIYWFVAISTIEMELAKYALTALTLLTVASIIWVARTQ